MSRFCIITGRKVAYGHNVSHANNKTKRLFYPNLQNVSIRSDTLDQSFHLRISTRGLRTLEFHGGLDRFLLTTRNSKLHPDLKKIKKKIAKD